MQPVVLRDLNLANAECVLVREALYRTGSMAEAAQLLGIARNPQAQDRLAAPSPRRGIVTPAITSAPAAQPRASAVVPPAGRASPSSNLRPR